jgi:hypothetical protein
MVHYHVHENPPLYPTLSQMQFTLSQAVSRIFILILFPHLRLGLPIGLTPSGFQAKISYEAPPGTHWLRGWVGPRAGLDAVAKRKNPFPVPTGNRTPVAQPVA